MTSPTIVFFHGFWVMPTIFEQVAKILNEAGFATDITHQNPSLGTTSPGNPSMDEDIASIRQSIEKLVDGEGLDVVLVLHSAAGYLACCAIRDLLKKDRQAKGKKGGVAKIIFLTAGIFPPGFKGDNKMTFAKVEGGSLLCKDPISLMFNDFDGPHTDTQTLMTRFFRTQPSEGWQTTVTYAAWQDMPTTYIICTLDALLPEALQEHFAALAGSKTVKIDAGHIAMLSKPKKVARAILTDLKEE